MTPEPAAPLASRTLMIVVEVKDASEAATWNYLHTCVKAAYPEWAHHLENVFWIRTTETEKEVLTWLLRVWPRVGPEGGAVSERVRSSQSCALVVEINPAELQGILPERAWGWLAKGRPA